MAKMVLGVFSNSDLANSAISDLERLGYDPKDMSIVMRDHETGKNITTEGGTTVAEGAASGATTGGVIGALAGLLIGIGAITVPGIGALLIGGPLAVALGLSGAAATTVSGAVTGALAGGLIGALTGYGVSEEDARVYEESIKAGGVLVVVPAQSGLEMQDVIDVMDQYNASQVRTVTTSQSRIDSRDELDREHHYPRI